MAMGIVIVSTGDELLSGELADANGPWAAARFLEHGYRVSSLELVGDDLDALTNVLARCFSEFDLAVVGGGLGPTVDDLTAAAAALATGTPLERKKAAENQVREAFGRRKRSMDPVNLKQCDLPANASLLSNPLGTAPGFYLEHSGCTAFFLPGVPAEYRTMFELYVIPLLPETSAANPALNLSCTGIGESDMQAVLSPLLSHRPELRAAFRASFPEVKVTLTAPDVTTLAQARVEALRILGTAVFSQTGDTLPAEVVGLLTRNGLTLAAAESCTGGLVGHVITEIPGASACFLGSVVAYHNRAKSDLLGVSKPFLEEHGAVSEAVVRSMAEGVRDRLGADIAVAVSGIAGPDGGTVEKPVGTVHMAVAHAGGTVHRSCVFAGLDRTRVKKAAAWMVLKLALDLVREGDHNGP